jgi:hypothetical protein
VYRHGGSLPRMLQQCVRRFAALPAEDHGAVSSSSAVQQQVGGILACDCNHQGRGHSPMQVLH